MYILFFKLKLLCGSNYDVKSICKSEVAWFKKKRDFLSLACRYVSITSRQCEPCRSQCQDSIWLTTDAKKPNTNTLAISADTSSNKI